jgi:hypothetical protein
LRVFEGEGKALFDSNDPDIQWLLPRWHVDEISVAQLPTTLYFCRQHARFHICGAHCDKLITHTHGSRMCVISRRITTAELCATFGDGTGTTEQAQKTREARGNASDDSAFEAFGGRSRRARRTTATRASVHRDEGDRKRSASSALGPTGNTAGGGGGNNSGGGVIAASTVATAKMPAKRSKTSKAKRVTSRAKQEPVDATLSGQEMLDAGIEVSDPSSLTAVHAFADVPFAERKPGAHDREFAIDRYYNWQRRAARRKIYHVPLAIISQAFFCDEEMFEKQCEKAASIVYIMLFGRERAAIELFRVEKANAQARKEVEQYVATRRKDRKAPIAEQMLLTQRATLGTADSTPHVDLDATLALLIETYYTLLVVEFYYQFMAMPMPAEALRDIDTEQAVASAFVFEQYVPIILDLMCSDFTSDNITILPHDTFLLRVQMPSSMVLKQLGMPDKMSTHVKRLVKQRIRSARTHSMPMRYLEATLFEWEELALIGVRSNAPDDAARELVDRFIARRIARLEAIGAV